MAWIIQLAVLIPILFTSVEAQGIEFFRVPSPKCENCSSTSSTEFICSVILNPQGTLSPQAWRITTPTNELISFNSTAQNAPDGFSFIPPGSIFPNGLTVSNVSGKDGFEFVCIGYDNSRPNEIIVAPPVELEVAGVPLIDCKIESSECRSNGTHCSFDANCNVTSVSCAAATIMATDNQVNINAACESGTCNVGINVPVSYSTLSLVGSNQCGDSLDEKLTVPPVTAPDDPDTTNERVKIGVGVGVPLSVITLSIIIFIIVVAVICKKKK